MLTKKNTNPQCNSLVSSNIKFKFFLSANLQLLGRVTELITVLSATHVTGGSFIVGFVFSNLIPILNEMPMLFPRAGDTTVCDIISFCWITGLFFLPVCEG